MQPISINEKSFKVSNETKTQPSVTKRNKTAEVAEICFADRQKIMIEPVQANPVEEEL